MTDAAKNSSHRWYQQEGLIQESLKDSNFKTQKDITHILALLWLPVSLRVDAEIILIALRPHPGLAQSYVLNL